MNLTAGGYIVAGYQKADVHRFYMHINLRVKQNINPLWERQKTLFKFFHKIDTVTGICEECQEHTILVAIVSEFYRCINCGHDTKQHINGSVRYLKLEESDKEWLRKQHSE